jgi:hypothetical protein
VTPELSAEIRGEVLAWNLMAACTYWPRMELIIRKLDALLTAADARRGLQNGTVDGTFLHASQG